MFFNFVSIPSGVLIFFCWSQWLFKQTEREVLLICIWIGAECIFAIGRTHKGTTTSAGEEEKGQRELQSNVQVCFRAISLCVSFPVSHSLSLFVLASLILLFLFCRFVDSIAYIKVHSHLLRCCCSCSTTHACHSNSRTNERKNEKEMTEQRICIHTKIKRKIKHTSPK